MRLSAQRAPALKMLRTRADRAMHAGDRLSVLLPSGARLLFGSDLLNTFVVDSGEYDALMNAPESPTA